jgi:hypothetical protein
MKRLRTNARNRRIIPQVFQARANALVANGNQIAGSGLILLVRHVNVRSSRC